ncbi:MAG: tetratricopeptide repeat protein [Bacteroidota bacterium]
MSEATEKGFFENLWERRFIQYLISYLVAAWGILQFTEWVTKRYALPNTWVDIIMIFLLALLPSVLLITYNHGRPGKDRWRTIEKIVLPANVVIAVCLVFFLFSGQSLQAMAAKVTVTNENGDTIERIVATGNAVQMLDLYNFENKTEDPSNQWLTSAVPILLAADLEQDIRFYCEPSFELNERLGKFDFSYQQEIPFSVKLKASEEAYKTQFMEGEISKEEDNWVIKTRVFGVSDGELFYENTYQGQDILPLIDDIASDYHQQVDNPEIQQEDQIDLPVGDLFTSNLEALQAFIQGETATFVENNPAKGLQSYQQALALDPNFIECHLSLGLLFNRVNQTEQAEASLEYAMEHSEALTERQQFRIRHMYYLNAKDNEKAIALLEMWRKLYPNSLTPYSRLIRAYSMRGELDKARAVGEEAIAAGQGGEILLAMAKLALVQGKTEDAEDYFKRFTEAYPNQAAETTELATIYQQQGEVDKAIAYLEELLLLKPNNSEVLTSLATIMYQNGQFKEAEKKYLKALQKSKTFDDSLNLYRNNMMFYYQTGKINQAINTLESLITCLESKFTPYEAQTNYLNFLSITIFKDGGRIDEIKGKIDQFLETYPDPAGIFPCAAQINIGIAEENAALVNEIMDNCYDNLLTLGGQNMMNQVTAYQLKFNGQYEESIQTFQKYFAELGLEDPSYDSLIADIYRLNKEPEKGLELLEPALKKSPYQADLYYLKGKCLRDAGNTAEAKVTIERALELWSDADENFLPLQKAKEDLAAL